MQLSIHLPTLLAFAVTILPTTGTPLPDSTNPLQARQTPLVLPGTCTVATNFCLVTWPYEPPTQSNYTCGRQITLLGSYTNPAKTCTSDGHVRLFLSYPLLAISLIGE